MTAPHYTPTGFPAEKALASSIRMREELALIEAGIDEMDTHVVSIMVQPWKTAASDTTHDWTLVMPFACQLVASTSVLLGAGPLLGSGTYFLYNRGLTDNFTLSANNFASVDDNGVVKESWNGGPFISGSASGEVAGATYLAAWDLDDADNNFVQGARMRIRTVANHQTPANDNVQALLSFRLRRV
jgi:hypothetical protein